ncbi:type II toxin-antitoxin system RelE/ParE family toxin [Methylocystis hirsuta]|uniref:Type II toxin-antitoxin system RelE/ParE family toxin n=1 Tax=Methylocystis hirsuta TaxID=369798 RepID=A0A3M9XNH8_9HYPH|nr:type II toxin-antitoxin system RelE/ParE family toxin [Methylocystis hirsuta]RNJ48658.1 type II toxin-antitoxin system RelE/ParE family toxin [Methylocystis hirsuta]
MLEVRKTGAFEAWLTGLKDQRGKAKIVARIDRLALGNPGDVSPVGEGVSELRIHFGPGYRVYFVRRGKALVVLLCGGDKGSQERDIAQAKSLAAELEDE